jgi:hypothetical protein
MYFLNKLKFALLIIAGMAIVFTSCKKDEEEDPIIVPDTLEFVGSETCKTCHAEQYDIFIKSGHPYKLSKIVDGVQPTIPYQTATIPTPAGYTWDDISYMIGGYGWKARFIDVNGYIMTENDDTQYNLADGSQVAYTSSAPMGTKKYDCGKCHLTGWVPIAEGGSPQDGLPGMGGEFAEPGITCEACHGMGNIHAITKLKTDIAIDNSSDLCGQCHTRNADNSIAAKGGFIKHHEQYDEWLVSGGHNTSNIGCNSCHDPHASTINDAQAPGQGIKASCKSCHTTYTSDAHAAMSLDCVSCHMPLASKSAIKTGDYTADIHSHTFMINPLSTGTLFNEADVVIGGTTYAPGTLANPEGKGLSLDYACYSCHKDAAGLGGNNSTKTMVELSARATNFHGTK